MFNNLLYTVFSRKIANELERQGFRIVSIKPNTRNNRYLVYYFEDSVAFRDALKALITK